MSCLKDSICQIDPSLQELFDAIENALTFTQLVLSAWRLARVLAVKIVEEVLFERAQRSTQWSDCPKCGKRLHSKGFVPRQITSLIGIIRWKRRVGRCPKGCTIGQIAPLDNALGLLPHQRTSVELQHLGCLLATFVPFETVAVLLNCLISVKVSSTAVWHWVQDAGQKAMDRLNDQLAELAAGQLPQMESLDEAISVLPLLVGGDGVMVPFRPEGGKGRTVWREVKVAVLARLGRRSKSNAPQLYQRRLVAVLGSIDALRPRLWLEALRQGVLTAPTVVWLSDGGVGFWGLYAACFAFYAIGILDFYHAAQNLWKGAKAWLDGRSKKARQWFTLARHRLRHGETNVVLNDIAAALELDGLPEIARKALKNLYEYLATHQYHIQYQKFKELGLPIGSGMVESACKWLIQQRFKGVGMRWSEDGFNHLLHLRLAWVNGRFDELFALEDSPN
jgi:hypothetical protein|tara:strand:+ start:215 stop:1564 length:1350 start_codon:yes stop_codon:yes gene_type:complete